MKILAALIISLLAGCATSDGFKNTEVIVQKEYIVRTAPDALKALPPLPSPLRNPTTATNSQVAKWISDTEVYIADLETRIKALINFYEAPVQPAEVSGAEPK